MKPLSVFLLLATLVPLGLAAAPNVVLIMTDNHGAWSLGCYGNPDIRTP
ncbi:MAG: sulfatase, partial [bacterium]|nr:sulfatase [bacterium]